MGLRMSQPECHPCRDYMVEGIVSQNLGAEAIVQSDERNNPHTTGEGIGFPLSETFA